MIFCGQEEPLCANQHIMVYDDTQHVCHSSEMTMRQLMRYSFVWQDIITSGEAALTTIGQHIVASLEGTAFWVNIWRIPVSGSSKHYALRALKTRRIRAGWQVATVGDLEYAWMPLPMAVTSLFWPPSYQSWEGCMCVLITDEDVVRTFPQDCHSQSLIRAATTGRVVPSHAWLTWCADTQASLLYAAMHHNDRDGLICVGPQCLPVQQWYAQQRLQRLFIGEEAYKAWQV